MRVAKLSNTTGFTLIELLLVIIIVGSLSASALPNVLDFRKDAQLAVLQQRLITMRVGMKNALLQIRVRCGAPMDAVLDQPTRYNTLVDTTGFAGWHTWVTAFTGTPSGDCSAGQIPRTAEWKLWEGDSGISGAPANSCRFLCNPFHSAGCATGTSDCSFYRALNVASCTGGKCSCDDLVANGITYGTYQWVFFRSQGELVAGTNAAQECDI